MHAEGFSLAVPGKRTHPDAESLRPGEGWELRLQGAARRSLRASRSRERQCARIYMQARRNRRRLGAAARTRLRVGRHVRGARVRMSSRRVGSRMQGALANVSVRTSRMDVRAHVRKVQVRCLCACVREQKREWDHRRPPQAASSSCVAAFRVTDRRLGM